jgi:hypothetical protein
LRFSPADDVAEEFVAAEQARKLDGQVMRRRCGLRIQGGQRVRKANRNDETVASARVVHNIAAVRLAFAKSLSQGRDVDRKICFDDHGIRPNDTQEIAAADEVAGPACQRYQDLQGSAAETYWPVALKEEPFGNQQSKWSKKDRAFPFNRRRVAYPVGSFKVSLVVGEGIHS